MAVRVIFGSAASSVSFSFDSHPSERVRGAWWGKAVVLLAAVELGVVRGVLWLFESLITSWWGNISDACLKRCAGKDGQPQTLLQGRQRDPVSAHTPGHIQRWLLCSSMCPSCRVVSGRALCSNLHSELANCCGSPGVCSSLVCLQCSPEQWCWACQRMLFFPLKGA